MSFAPSMVGAKREISMVAVGRIAGSVLDSTGLTLVTREATCVCGPGLFDGDFSCDWEVAAIGNSCMGTDLCGTTLQRPRRWGKKFKKASHCNDANLG